MEEVDWERFIDDYVTSPESHPLLINVVEAQKIMQEMFNSDEIQNVRRNMDQVVFLTYKQKCEFVCFNSLSKKKSYPLLCPQNTKKKPTPMHTQALRLFSCSCF